MKKHNQILIDFEDWEYEGLKSKLKSQITFLADPQPAPGQKIQVDKDSPIGFSYTDSEVEIKNPLNANWGQLLFNKKHKNHIQITQQIKVWRLQDFTEEDAIAEGMACLYPHSHVGGYEGFYLPDQILEASAVDCLKHYWDAKYPDFPFDSNPCVITFGLKITR